MTILRQSNNSGDLVGTLLAFERQYRVQAQQRVDDDQESSRESWRVSFTPIKGGGEAVALLREAEIRAPHECHFVGVTGLAGRRCKVRGYRMPDSLRLVVVDRSEGA
jgi:hypothetical protein